MKKFILTGLFIALLISLLVTQDNESIEPKKSVNNQEVKKQEYEQLTDKQLSSKEANVSEISIEPGF